MKNITLFVAGTRAEELEPLRAALSEDPSIEVLGLAQDPLQALEQVRRLTPEVLLWDTTALDATGIAQLESLSRRRAGTSIILLAGPLGKQDLRRALQAGVTEYLTKPYSSDQLLSAIHRVKELNVIRQEGDAAPSATSPSPKNTATTIAVISGKGGVGKSTLVANLAVSLSKAHKNVCVVDLALRFGDQQVYFNRTKHPTLVEWVHLLEEEKQPPLICVVETSIPGVRVVLGPKSPEFAELIRPEHIYNLLQQLSTRFDYILLDTADPTDEHLLEILPKIDKFLLLTTSSLSSLKDAALLLNLLSELKVASNKVSVVHSQLHPQSPATAELTEALQQPIAQWLPYEPTLIESSIAQGVPVVASKPNCEFSKAVDRLSDLLRSATPESPSAAPKGKRGWRLSRSL